MICATLLYMMIGSQAASNVQQANGRVLQRRVRRGKVDKPHTNCHGGYLVAGKTQLRKVGSRNVFVEISPKLATPPLSAHRKDVIHTHHNSHGHRTMLYRITQGSAAHCSKQRLRIPRMK